MKYYTSDNAKKLGLPFSEAIQVDDFVILSGQLGMDPATGKLVEGGLEAETHQTFKNIKATLAAFDLGLEDVVKCTIMLEDIKDWPAFNKIYVTYFPGDKKPTRSAFGTSGLALGAKMEVECWAVARDNKDD